MKLTYRCTNRCKFCRVDDYRGLVSDLSLEEAARRLYEAKALGVEMVLFSGGEPTLYPHLFRLIKVAGALGLRFGLITNGRRLADVKFAKTLMDYGLAYVHTSLHGATKETHDKTVQCQGFDEVLEGLHNIKGSQVEIHVNTVINRLNIAELYEIAKVLSRFGPLTYKLCLMEPRGLFLRHEEELILPPHEVARVATEVALKVRADFWSEGLFCEVEGFPYCQVPKDLSASLHSHNIRYMCEAFEDRFYETDFGERTYPQVCEGCAVRMECPGVYRGYVERFGEVGLSPL